ncbi:MAG: hypothetical protein MI741_23930, partial [Rhodospirillales bacterium]|nr:hypothetical protein [Rhodospirillales bacterium]
MEAVVMQNQGADAQIAPTFARRGLATMSLPVLLALVQIGEKDAENDVQAIWWNLGMVIIAAVVLIIAVLIVRKRLTGSDEPDVPTGFGLS